MTAATRSGTSQGPPTVASRAGVGFLVALLLALGYVVAPWLLLAGLAAFGIPPPFDVSTLVLAGIVLTALGCAQYLLKPTRAYGPVAMLYSVAGIAYLLWLASRSPLSLEFHGVGLSVGYSGLLLTALAIPVLSLAAGIATTVEDAMDPGERIPFDFPSPSVGR